MPKVKWISTDPDNDQFGRRIPGKEGVFEFKQKNHSGEEVKETIDLGEWKLKKVEEIINSYGYTLHKKKAEKHGNQFIYEAVADVDWTIAECIFETQI
jgi:hypothetical protein